MGTEKQATQRKTALLTVNLLSVIRRHEWGGEEIRQQAAHAVQDNFLSGNSKATQIELKAGHFLSLHYEYVGMPNGFTLQIGYDEDRVINLGNCGANRAWINYRGAVTKNIDLTKGDYAVEQSARIAGFLNE